MEVNDRIEEVKDLANKTSDYIAEKKYLDYAVYAKYKGKIKMS